MISQLGSSINFNANKVFESLFGLNIATLVSIFPFNFFRALGLTAAHFRYLVSIQNLVNFPYKTIIDLISTRFSALIKRKCDSTFLSFFMEKNRRKVKSYYE